MILYILGSFYLIIFVTFVILNILIVKNDYLLRKGHVILEGMFKVFGHIFVIINYILFVPSMMIFAEIERCDKQIDPNFVDYHFVCLEGHHFSLLIFTAISAFSSIILVIYTNLFINSQFPNESVPYACWDSKYRAISTIWKVVYIWHYDILDDRYRMALRIGAFIILIYKLFYLMEQPQLYNRLIHWYQLSKVGFVVVLHFFIVTEDILSEYVYFEMLPLIVIIGFLFSGILISYQAWYHKHMISKDNRVQAHFTSENDMQLYISLLLIELVKLKTLDKGPEYSSSPEIFTIISRHMERCKNEDCICKKYEPEYDKKFSSIGSRRLTMRQSTSFSSIDYMFKKKIPIKISYETKCGIFMAEISDCIDRFLEYLEKENKDMVGLKLQKSFFNHAYMNSSYKALFVQLENSHACGSFRGRINIFHLKTKIQEEMTQSEASPFSMDITTCLKFESKRVKFEEKIIELCIICESFWNELTQNEHEYKVEKIHVLLLEISQTIIEIKQIYYQLCQYNPQNVDVIQNYALIYRYILRDEFRFNDIINNLNQLKKTNKLEQTRELIPKFFDSDNYAMILVSGDIKDLGRMIKANRGVEYIFGYMPNELQGGKINKVMPRLYSQIHDEFIGNFLKRGHSTFIDRTQFLLIENKLRFIQMTLAYVKAMVDLKIGLMFVSFFKLPLKVPSNQEGNNYIKAKDAHYILCDAKGQIHGISHNCMKNLGIPPTIISRSKSLLDVGSLVSIEQFSPNILGPEYEFDLPKGMNFHFDTTSFKGDKYLAKEFNELTGRMRKYNIFISLKKQEFRLGQNNLHEILLFTIEIISFQLSEAPITIPVDKEEDQSYTQYSGTTVSSVNSDELRTSKFKEFKAQVQELKVPSRISLLRKITIAFFIFLLAIFSLNYALCATQNQSYINRVQVLDILYELTNKIPSTSRYVRTVINIANGYENNTNEVISDRFSYYMRRISENSEKFRDLQQEIYTKFKADLSLDEIKLKIKDLQTDLTIKTIDSTISSSLNMFSSKALQISKLKKSQLANIQVPYISFDFKTAGSSYQLSGVQQALYFILQNGHESIPQALLKLNEISQDHIEKQSNTFMLVSLVIAVISIVINFVIVPIVYPLLVHYEKLAYYILHSLNKLTKKFVENEVKCCNQLFTYIGKKQGSGVNDKKGGVMMKKPDARKENKQLMRVNPKIPKHLLEQEKKKHQQKRDRRLRRNQNGENGELNEEEEKGLMLKVEQLDREVDPDDGSGLLDEDLDEDHESKQSRGRALRRDPDMNSHHASQFQHYTASMASIDESTVRTSVDVNSSTNKSSDHNSSDEDEDHGDSYSSSTQSNYTHYTNVSQWKMLKQSQFGEQVKSNASMTYDITQAKSSELAGDNYNDKEHAEMTDEEKELKRLVRERQHKIKATLKSRKCKKVFYLILLVIIISIYLGVNTMYTRFVFEYENQLQDNINTIDERMLCYPFSLTLLKEMVSRNSSIVSQFYSSGSAPSSSLDRTYVLNCYENEQRFGKMVMGEFNIKSTGMGSLAKTYLQIQESLGKNDLCQTLYSSDPGKFQLCSDSYNGISNLGLYEILNFILRNEELVIIQFSSSQSQRQVLINLLKNSDLTELESIKDYFIDDAFQVQRQRMIDEIQVFAEQLFRIFDILFSVFVSVCFLLVTIGVFYMIKKLQELIIQIYHIVLLIPYGERTKRELNELLKINL